MFRNLVRPGFATTAGETWIVLEGEQDDGADPGSKGT
jgi:hypothetical protein